MLAVSAVFAIVSCNGANRLHCRSPYIYVLLSKRADTLGNSIPPESGFFIPRVLTTVEDGLPSGDSARIRELQALHPDRIQDVSTDVSARGISGQRCCWQKSGS
jgi:hypothetical protein